MRYGVIGFILSLSSIVSQAQTLTIPSFPSRPEAAIERCVDCDTHVAPSESNQVEPSVRASESPDAPSAIPSMTLEPPAWNLAEPKTSALATRRDPVWDKKMMAAHLFLVGSIVFDVEATHQGIAHHMCVEGNTNLNRKPSRGELYLDNLEQFAPVVVMDGLTALAGRSAHLPRWAWKALGYVGPVYGSTMHLRGGIQWLTQCW